MPYAYSEDALIEQTAISIFKDLKWETANVLQGERFGVGGTLGRASEADVLLLERFLRAVRLCNPGLPEAAYLAAFETLNADDVSKTLADLNHEKYQILKEGIPVSYENEKGERIEGKRIRVFNFDAPAENDFLAVQQMWLEGKSKRRKRPDIVGFVNGIPLVFIELKAHHRKLRVAYETNLSDYKNTLPRLFHCNAVIILSNGIESKIGSLTSKFEHFHDWKRIREDEEGVVSLDTILRGVCDKSRLLDLFENFILFDNSVGKMVKLIARNHQFIGVNKAVEHFQNQIKRRKNGETSAEEAKRLGVFWHTQGSGKSYSMVFLCQKIQRQFGGAYTFLLVTDRVELDKQIYGTFAGVGAVTNKKARAGSGKDLKELLGTDEKYIFSLIHKFNFDSTVTERENIIVISDEAHRTQGGSLALNMRKALPNASFIGFTGTPLFKDDELTRRIFGDYVSVCDFKRSVEDGATVPLYYENRGEKLRLDNPKISDEIRAAIEAAELDPDQEEKLKRLFSRDYPILTAEKRLRSIAKDVVEHFNNRGYKYKAILPDTAIYAFQAQRDAINAIYAVIHRNEEESDISAIVKQVQAVVDKSIESLDIALEPVDGYGNKVDLSGLDFELIEREFLKLGDKQPIAVQSLKDKVEAKLNQMLRDNPFRVDFYERYQEIIEAYNHGKEYAAIKEIFDQLVGFLNDLSEEEKRAVREDLSEEELAVVDMLSRDKKISDKEKAELKDIAKELLERLKEKEFKIIHWADKEQTASAVKVVIKNYLFDKLPYPVFEEVDVNVKTEVLFEFFKGSMRRGWRRELSGGFKFQTQQSLELS